MLKSLISYLQNANLMIQISAVAIILTLVGIVFALTYFKKWGWLWREWITTVDHKKIGIMYLVCALLMFFRGGVDALLMRTQLAFPNLHFLNAQHYDEIFTTHGTIMILFMAMPFIFAMFNLVVPLQIGARDVAFPFLNAVSFWLFFFGAMLFNLSFVLGGSPDAGWVGYPPLSELPYSPGPGVNYYVLGIQISGIGSIATGINFIVTILKMRAPGMTLMRMPLFTWSVLASCIVIIFAFPALTVALALLGMDRIFGTHFFTMLHGGNPMMYINLFWVWGHPEVYIVILPAYGIFSEVVSTFCRKYIFGYKSMVVSLMMISIISYFVWVHHFFTMGAGPGVNSFFAVASMAVGIPTGVKVFNWLFTMFRGRIRITLPMLWTLAFIPCFAVGGATGIMLAVAPADYQFHNSYFLIAHFHQVLIGGVVYGLLAGMYFWWPKILGFKLNETLGKWAFWFFNLGFYVCFMPQYALGFMGMTRRVYTYPAESGWGTLNFVSTIGAFMMGIGFLFIVAQILYSIRHGERDTTGDPWDGRTLEWSLPSPVPHYNFAQIPVVDDMDAWWKMKQQQKEGIQPQKEPLKPIHMPSPSSLPFFMGLAFFICGFGLVFNQFTIATIGLIGVVICMLWRSLEKDTGYYISVEEIKKNEAAVRGL
ncbi:MULTISPECIES: cytochrome aa3 quinol oxidase subunit I [Thermoactinomyces]|jgi:cytochrome aa3-600 menaquinol oxidase subunit I|uniref:Quinol oxidase subunit 1 n=1 Tax=Thermoactinomyces daqus TaxID=1329516 RepID=A0A7W1XBI1_9BACL|nr:MULTISPECIES: cytochrome aa3 quinol oxidase subunit I [Thermoactinomyces]MBA4543618.1 cytochrome aa3 quinol oxidase subunit I [Thermoactinomyces daqus]MBH8596519.1 cytochrome aa3 quinol oxidase subunit I [Thermoactinomyces sp. CICC 10523]MBH8603281.1 cytochrome aa3 quinol oxidase subunit I [Thermoactinomyces sp. CICC 10522]MBH8609029.1 cytochrome aa3 quinol oxidase subunit I [Thermoactinomyces sp. CICC 10521]